MKLEKEHLITLYTNMVRARKADEVIVKGLQDGKVASFYGEYITVADRY